MIHNTCSDGNRIRINKTPAFPSHKIEGIDYRIKFLQPAIVCSETIVFPYTSFFAKVNFYGDFIAK